MSWQNAPATNSPAGVRRRVPTSAAATVLHWWHDLVEPASDACPMREHGADMLFLLYTSGSTGKPKGIVHTTGGYMVTIFTAKTAFNLAPSDRGGTVTCSGASADIGWSRGTRTCSTASCQPLVPTLGSEKTLTSRAARSAGPGRPVLGHHRRATGSRTSTPPHGHPRVHEVGRRPAGTPRSFVASAARERGRAHQPEAWIWYHEHIGGARNGARVARSSTHTGRPETGGHVCTPSRATPTKPGSCTMPMFGIDAAVVNEQGQEPGDPTRAGCSLSVAPGRECCGIYGNRTLREQLLRQSAKDPEDRRALVLR